MATTTIGVTSRRFAQLSISRFGLSPSYLSLPGNKIISQRCICSALLKSNSSVHVRPPKPQTMAVAAISRSTSRSFASGGKKRGGKPESNSQNEEWVKFQENLEVKAVGDTGSSQRLAEAIANLGNRSNAMQKKMVKTLTRSGSITPSEIGGGFYPPARLSDEETESLLKEAYANLPERTGKRGTKALKRQRRRWKLVRDIHKKYKQGKVRAHFRKTAHRGALTRECQAIRADAPTLRDTEKDYQMIVLRGWAQRALLETDPDSVNTAHVTHASVKDSSA